MFGMSLIFWIHPIVSKLCLLPFPENICSMAFREGKKGSGTMNVRWVPPFARQSPLLKAIPHHALEFTKILTFFGGPVVGPVFKLFKTYAHTDFNYILFSVEDKSIFSKTNVLPSFSFVLSVYLIFTVSPMLSRISCQSSLLGIINIKFLTKTC